ncbi:MAG: NUDIX domain-containing protein [Acidimicrobiia bacterium]
MRTSAGLLPFRRESGLEVLIAHPGGPFWARKDVGAWSVIKGEMDPGEEPLAAAVREFCEETGWPAPVADDYLDLGSAKLKSGKLIRCWAFEADFDPATLVPGTFPAVISGRTVVVPEIDRVAWVSPRDAADRLNPAQVAFVERLEAALP